MSTAPLKADFQALLSALPQPAGGHYPNGTPFVQALAHGSLSVELFAPANWAATSSSRTRRTSCTWCSAGPRGSGATARPRP